jgi:hypothetical protein
MQQENLFCLKGELILVGLLETWKSIAFNAIVASLM